MSEYESLAEQVKSDYQAIMTGLADVKKGIDTVSTRMESLNGTVLRALHLMEHLEARVEKLEGLESRLESLEKRVPPAA